MTTPTPPPLTTAIEKVRLLIRQGVLPYNHDVIALCDHAAEASRAAEERGAMRERAAVVEALSAAAANADASVSDEDCDALSGIPEKVFEVIGGIASAQLCKALVEKIEAGKHIGAAKAGEGE